MTIFRCKVVRNVVRLRVWGKQGLPEHLEQEKAGLGLVRTGGDADGVFGHGKGRIARSLIVALALGAAPAMAAITEPVPVPSERAVVLQDVIAEDAAGADVTLRFRFLAPGVVRAAADTGAEEDMDHLCASFALPYLVALGETPDLIVISLADRPVAFGEISPEIIQFFEAYRPDGNACIWEGL